MVILSLGVLDVNYSTAHGMNATPTTTYEVAKKLEEKYHVMQTFYNSRKEKIAQFLADDMANSLQDMMQGTAIAASKGRAFSNKFHKIKEKYSTSSLTYGADQRIEAEFRDFIFANEMQKMSLTPDVPISAAAFKGVNHRFKKPYAKKNKPRPNFVDTGLYVASFRVWTK